MSKVWPKILRTDLMEFLSDLFTFRREVAISRWICTWFEASHYTPAPPRFSTPRTFFEALLGVKSAFETGPTVLYALDQYSLSLQNRLCEPSSHSPRLSVAKQFDQPWVIFVWGLAAFKGHLRPSHLKKTTPWLKLDSKHGHLCRKVTVVWSSSLLLLCGCHRFHLQPPVSAILRPNSRNKNPIFLLPTFLVRFTWRLPSRFNIGWVKHSR